MTHRLAAIGIVLGSGFVLAWLCIPEPSAATTAARSSLVAKSEARCTVASAKPKATVHASNHFRFVPSFVCLRLGGTVTWKNTTSDLDHTSTDEPGLAASPGDATIPRGGHGWNLLLPTGRSAHRTFRTAGVYHYFCILHETLGMLGVIDVVRAR